MGEILLSGIHYGDQSRNDILYKKRMPLPSGMTLPQREGQKDLCWGKSSFSSDLCRQLQDVWSSCLCSVFSGALGIVGQAAFHLCSWVSRSNRHKSHVMSTHQLGQDEDSRKDCVQAFTSQPCLIDGDTGKHSDLDGNESQKEERKKGN